MRVLRSWTRRWGLVSLMNHTRRLWRIIAKIAPRMGETIQVERIRVNVFRSVTEPLNRFQPMIDPTTA